MGRLAVMAILIAALAIWGRAHAAVFQCPSGDVACLSAAINTANANGEENTITLAAGTYILTTAAGPSGLPSITSSMTIRGDGAESTVIERSITAHPFRIILVDAGGILTLDRLTIRGGFVAGQNDGGGIFNGGGTVMITNSMIADNHADFGGGGGLINSAGTMTITNSIIARNQAVSSGGLVNGNRGTLSITNSVMEDNHASAAGGGLFNCGGFVTITNSTIARNHAGSEVGGGLVNTCGGRMTILNSTIADNQADESEGGGLSNDFNGVVTITSSTIAGNIAKSFGGGLVNGGHFNGGPGTLTIINTTIADNIAGSGGGLGQFLGMLALQNTILARNAAESSSPDCLGPITSLGNNLVGDTSSCIIPLQTSDLTGNPGLGEFTDDGAPGHGYFPLLASSRAINAGNDAVCPPTDQLEQSRVGICDRGAIEFQPLVVDTTPPAIAISASPTTLWPPNGKLVPVAVSGTMTDEPGGSGVNASSAAYVVMDEYGQIQPHGSLTLGADGSYAFTVALEASRKGNDQDGRHYTIAVSAKDNAGNLGVASIIVTVPHDQGN